jgi:hypothetical protein
VGRRRSDAEGFPEPLLKAAEVVLTADASEDAAPPPASLPEATDELGSGPAGVEG